MATTLPFAPNSMPAKENKDILGKLERYPTHDKLLTDGLVVFADKLIDASCGLNDPPQGAS